MSEANTRQFFEENDAVMHKINEVPDEADHIDLMNSIGTPGVSGSLKKARNP